MAKVKDYNKARPRADAYTGMLMISLLILAGGCVLLFLDYQQYEYGKKPPSVPNYTSPSPGNQNPPGGGVVPPPGGGVVPPPGGGVVPPPGGGVVPPGAQ